MKIEHVALYVNELEEAREFFIKYLDGSSNAGYHNKNTGIMVSVSSWWSFFEDNASDSSSAKYFLTVDDFNPGAKILYENLGYKCVGELPDFYKNGINCYLMMKRRG